MVAGRWGSGAAGQSVRRLVSLSAVGRLAALRPRRLAEQKLLHILKQELLRLRVPQVQSVVVDELLLGLGPFRPADAAYLFEGPAADVAGKRLEGHPLAGLAASGALECRHGGKIGGTGNVIQSTGREPPNRYNGSWGEPPQLHIRSPDQAGATGRTEAGADAENHCCSYSY